MGATATAAAVRRGRQAKGPAIALEDVRQQVRVQSTAALVVLCVDTSGSMGVKRRLETAKVAVSSLLVDAYQHRDRVALVAFHHQDAEVVLRPTGSIEVARARLDAMRSGGRTPLAAGIDLAAEVASSASAYRPLVVVVSDGRATEAPHDQDPMSAAIEAAARLRRSGMASVVVDAEDGPARLGLAEVLAEAMGASLHSAENLSGEAVAGAVRRELHRS